MWIEEKILLKASPEKIFDVYTNVEGWYEWDADVKSSSISGEFQKGVEGVLIPLKGPTAKFALVEVTLNQSFSTETMLPLCCMRFEHELKSSGEFTEVTHRVGFTGVLSFIWRRLIGSQIKQGLPHALNGLKTICE